VRRLAFAVLVAALALTGLVPSAAASTSSLGKVSVAGAAGEKPTLRFPLPFAVTKTGHRTITAGSGDKLKKGAKVVADYEIVDGRTAKEVTTTFGSSPASIVLDTKQGAKGIVNSLIGSAVGSRVLIAYAPKDGLASNIASNQPGAGVKKTDTLLVLVDVRGIRTPLSRASGDAVASVTGLPTVQLAANGKPSITLPGGNPPSTLVSQLLIKGTGTTVATGQTITVHYLGVIWGSGKQFDSSWDRKAPVDFAIGSGQVIPGWDKGLVGQTVGSQLLLVVPPGDGYGASGNSQAGISGTDTLVFVVDILDAY
jgi:peptidylprolyl isomerase